MAMQEMLLAVVAGCGEVVQFAIAFKSSTAHQHWIMLAMMKRNFHNCAIECWITFLNGSLVSSSSNSNWFCHLGRDQHFRLPSLSSKNFRDATFLL